MFLDWHCANADRTPGQERLKKRLLEFYHLSTLPKKLLRLFLPGGQFAEVWPLQVIIA